MKHIKNLIIIILAAIASIVFLSFMWEKEWRPLAEMTELGYLELSPVAKATKPITLSNGHESTQYYVVVEVPTEQGLQRFSIEIEEAYGEKDLVKSLNAYSDKKTVNGYYFYSGEKGKAYFSKEIATAKAYMESRADVIVQTVLLLNVFLWIVLLLTTGLSTTTLPTIPGGSWTKEQMIVCRYNNIAYGTLAVLCITVGGVMLFLSYHLLSTAETADYIFAGMLIGVLAIAFFAMGILFILFMKNYTLVLYPQGIVYRNALGKTWSFTDEQIQYVSVIHAYRNHSFRIQTEEKNVWINYYCTNYNQAEQYVVRKYPDMEAYQKDNEKRSSLQ